MKPERWECHVCGERFRAWATVERHMDREHGGGRIECIMEEER